MKAYELLYFVDPTCNEETRAAVMKRIEVALGETGKVDSVEDWGSPSSIEFCASTTPSSATWSCAASTRTRHGSAGRMARR